MKNKSLLIGVLLFVLLCPIPAFAQAITTEDLSSMLFFIIILTFFAAPAYLYPLAQILHPDKKLRYFLLYLGIRLLILLIISSIDVNLTFFIDFGALIVGSIIISMLRLKKTMTPIIMPLQNNNMPHITIKALICPKCGKEYIAGNTYCTSCHTDLIANTSLKCSNCNGVIKATDNFCQTCGIKLVGTQQAPESLPSNTTITEANVNTNLFNSTDKLLENLISKELQKINFLNTDRIKQVEKRKFIITLIFSLITFFFIVLIFFHFPIYIYAIGLLLLIIYIYTLKKYTVVNYLKKEIKARPDDKMVNIISSLTNDKVPTNKIKHIIPMIIATILPLFLFIKPVTLYEKTNEGYFVRFYAFGLTNMTSATIPEEYKGKKVIGLRGNTFSNMFFLTKVTLPDTVKEIRGQAFKNDRNLTTVTLPKNLEYLGGGAFYNCSSLTSIKLPDTLKELRGETFMNCSSLTDITLPKHIPEIRGNTFEGCTSLESIEIPTGVTRIGGHAFYGCSSLSNVSIPSTITEIGSSAFRLCSSLYTITLPIEAQVSEKAFKESPTTIHYYGKNTTTNNYYNDYNDTNY